MVDVPAGAVDDAADCHPDPQRPPAVPPPEVPPCAVGQRGQRRTLGTSRCRGLDGVEGAAEQVGGHDAGGSCPDVDAQRQERLVVDLDRHPGTADRTGDRQVGAFPEKARVQ